MEPAVRAREPAQEPTKVRSAQTRAPAQVPGQGRSPCDASPRVQVRPFRPPQVMALQSTVGNLAVQQLLVARLRWVDGIQRAASSRKLRTRTTPKTPEGAVLSSRLPKLGTLEETEFRRRVYQRQLEETAANPKKVFLEALPEGELDPITPKEKMQKGVVATKAKQMLAAAAADLEAKRKATRLTGTRFTVRSIGVGSAYRDLQRELRAWLTAYGTTFKKTKEKRARLAGGEYGDAAAALLVGILHRTKAIPGYSKHTKGLAIDFVTNEFGVSFGPSTSQTRREIEVAAAKARRAGLKPKPKKAWEDTWLFEWLKEHAWEYGFARLKGKAGEDEPWHWQYEPREEGWAAEVPHPLPPRSGNLPQPAPM